jgi:hypothetical protein
MLGKKPEANEYPPSFAQGNGEEGEEPIAKSRDPLQNSRLMQPEFVEEA